MSALAVALAVAAALPAQADDASLAHCIASLNSAGVHVGTPPEDPVRCTVSFTVDTGGPVSIELEHDANFTGSIFACLATETSWTVPCIAWREGDYVAGVATRTATVIPMPVLEPGQYWLSVQGTASDANWDGRAAIPLLVCETLHRMGVPAPCSTNVVQGGAGTWAGVGTFGARIDAA